MAGKNWANRKYEANAEKWKKRTGELEKEKLLESIQVIFTLYVHYCLIKMTSPLQDFLNVY